MVWTCCSKACVKLHSYLCLIATFSYRLTPALDCTANLEPAPGSYWIWKKIGTLVHFSTFFLPPFNWNHNYHFQMIYIDYIKY